MTTDYRLVISMARGPDITLTCESEHELKRRAAELSEVWKQAITADPMNAIMQIQGQHGMHSVPAYLVMRIDPVVRERATDSLLDHWKPAASSTTVHPSLADTYRRMTDHDRDRED